MNHDNLRIEFTTRVLCSMFLLVGCRAGVTNSATGHASNSAPGGISSRASGDSGSESRGGSGAKGSTYRNPVIRGFHPDPSIVRVADDYYLVSSSFEYFPGIPIFHSRDLVHWRPIGHCLTRASQVPLASAKSSEGIFAPTIRFNGDTFYVITTNVSGGGNFYVTAKDPAGDWSDPIKITGDASSGGIDPSLFFDDDGKVYFTRHGNGENGAIFQAELDISTGKLASRPIQIWAGTGGIWPEGPHLYKIGQSYYLMISEGGTSYGHMLTIARAASPMGPFTAFSGNPILSHRNRPESPIQATGHADLVQTPSGAWWMVLLGVRPSDGAGRHHHLGRETFLAPVGWDGENWPIVNGNQPIAFDMTTAGLPTQLPATVEAVRDDFTAKQLAFAWNLLRNPSASLWSLSARPGFLRLSGTQASLDSVGSPAFVGRRQGDFRAHVATLVDFTPDRAGEEAGLTVRANEDDHYDLAITQVGSERRIRLKSRNAAVTTIVSESALPAGLVTLSIEAYRDHYDFFVATPTDPDRRSLGTAPTTPLSSEIAGGFTGVYFGMYAWAGTGGSSMPPADFDWFDYQPLD